MRNQFLKFAKDFSTVDVAGSPGYKTLLALAKHPEAYYPDPDETAGNIKIEVDQSFVDDQELFDATIDGYVKGLSRLYNQLVRDFPLRTANNIFASTVKTMVLKYRS